MIPKIERIEKGLSDAFADIQLNTIGLYRDTRSSQWELVIDDDGGIFTTVKLKQFGGYDISYYPKEKPERPDNGNENSWVTGMLNRQRGLKSYQELPKDFSNLQDLKNDPIKFSDWLKEIDY